MENSGQKMLLWIYFLTFFLLFRFLSVLADGLKACALPWSHAASPSAFPILLPPVPALPRALTQILSRELRALSLDVLLPWL